MNIIKYKKIWFAISGAIILAGILVALISGVNAGIDFTGGTMMEIELHRYVPASEIREIFDEYDPKASINLLGRQLGEEKTTVQIRTTQDFDSEKRREIFNKFKEKYNLEDNDLINVEHFGPAMGKEIQNKAILAVIISAIGMLAYISYRFEWRFGLAAIIALIHDLLIVFAVYSVLRVPVNSPFVAAMLAILGYSINDTIVVFDRIRENLRFIKKSNYAQVASDSIVQTFSRTINTSVTTLITIVTLYILGVDQIRDFALPLIAGIISGTYSSVFIASPIWVMLKEKQNKRPLFNAKPESN